MKTRIAIIAAGALLYGGLLTLTTAAFAETTANNSGRPLENVQAPPQGAADTGYFVAGGVAPAAKGTKSKARSSHRH